MKKKLKSVLIWFLIFTFNLSLGSFREVFADNNDAVLATAITLSKNEDKLLVNQTDTLTAVVTPDNASNKGVTWSSSDTNTAAVDQNGKITALKVGTVTITAATQDGSNLSSSCTVSITRLANSIVLNKMVDKLPVGQTDLLTALVRPLDSAVKDVTWTTSDPSVVSVDDKGNIKALKLGMAVVTAAVNDGRNLHASCNVYVTNLLSKRKKADLVVTLDNSMNIDKTTFKDKLNKYIESKLKGSNIDYTIQSIQGYKSKKVLIIQDQPAWESGTKVYDDIKQEGYTSDVITANQISSTELTQYSHIYIPSDQAQSFYDELNQNYSKLEAWTKGGGILIFNAADEGHHSGQWQGSFLGLTHTPSDFQPTITIVKQDPILTANLKTTITGNYAAHSQFTSYPSNSIIFAVGNKNLPTILEYRYGDGLVFAQTTTAEFYATNSGDLSPYLDNEIKYTIQKTLGRSFSDILKKPTWRENSEKFVINLGDTLANDVKENSMAQTLAELESNKAYVTLIGNNNNKDTLNSFINKNDGRGMFIDNSDLDGALSKAGDYIMTVLNKEEQNSNMFLTDDYINYNESSSEDVSWSYTQDCKHLNYDNDFVNCSKTGDIALDNDLGISDFANGQWVNNEINEFKKPGKYTIAYKFKDNAIVNETVNVNRKPTPIFTAYTAQDAVSGKYDVVIKDEDKSYDIDHENSDGDRKGIVNSKFQWKEVTQGVNDTWHDGKLPSGQDSNKDFIVKLEVQDLEGQWSNPLVKYITTRNSNVAPHAQFTESAEEMPVDQLNNDASVGMDAIFTDESYDANGDSIREHWIVTDNNGNTIYDSTSMPKASVFVGKPLGTYNVTLTCDDGPTPKVGAMLTSDSYTLQLKLVPINHKPVAKFEVDNTSKVPADIKITEDSTDPDGDKITEKDWTVTDDKGKVVLQTENKLPDLSNLNGSYTITLKVKDSPVGLPELWSDPLSKTIIVEGAK
ncbi:uncharacterized protein YjdB [Clostridium acetobutylicum]|uniref:Uncharacterized protein CA_P0160 n=1 Tax=Clostridium acetobutylicum (strain ATCC 824 / DSM 792 / JCM 1419 / IAM 19013 / LMG 5710 / NBRC 13948 / NRRL B-527 / VKM B-1787 / 2291 / W) TaxID=272562 RepID=Y4160_CLOAB|nr:MULTISPECIES: Ig domain-containing protein [Clostridium]P33747.2 RecName: Full=Uncharacterized protein CA_P0160; Flags: Precursor [Clostridium acetobutylicum ATCC 824]AAK76905.1 Secreted protein containing cell-adhesion domains [Clostridium acetobutylicum ATCC 824]ADZ22941.1 Secreted protein containing cell-adhesion domains [Clostridium acetobutylicum EA 2018]AEI34901.1 cell-adhesion domain-containing protein [Clostridium acetobutylicum DSM 1731]AWV82272.1 hypothetical protein DK921_19460 [